MTPPPPVPTNLGTMLRLYRTVRGRGLRDMATEVGIGHATLMRIEQGRAFDAETLLKIWSWLMTTKVE